MAGDFSGDPPWENPDNPGVEDYIWERPGPPKESETEKHTRERDEHLEELNDRIEASYNSSCIVATLVYRDVNAPQVQALREMRDTSWANSSIGRLATRIYYSGVGKAVAIVLKNVPSLLPVVRAGLDYLVERHSSRK